jgi:hypothetical protein
MRSYRQSVAGKNVNTEAEESTVLGAVTKQQPEDLVRATVNYKVREFAITPQSIVVTVFKNQINPITDTKPASSH